MHAIITPVLDTPANDTFMLTGISIVPNIMKSGIEERDANAEVVIHTEDQVQFTFSSPVVEHV